MIDWKEEMKDSPYKYTDQFLLSEIKNLKSRVNELEKQLKNDGK